MCLIGFVQPALGMSCVSSLLSIENEASASKRRAPKSRSAYSCVTESRRSKSVAGRQLCCLADVSIGKSRSLRL